MNYLTRHPALVPINHETVSRTAQLARSLVVKDGAGAHLNSLVANPDSDGRCQIGPEAGLEVRARGS
jgi:hypothetical protein